MCVCAVPVSVGSADKLISLFKDATGNTLQTDIELTADLDFSSSALTLPLGVSDDGTCVSFSGVIQGNGHSIKNLKMDNTNNAGYKDAGLFCSLKDSTVEDLAIDSSCSFTGYSAGALSVLVTGLLTVKHTTNNAAVNGSWNVGGFIGFVQDMEQPIVISFEDCVNHANVTGDGDYVGGFVGYICNNTDIVMTISNSVNNGIITGSDYYVGGFIGDIYNNTNAIALISNSTNNGIVTGSYEYVGGFVGDIYININMTMTISNSTNNGIVIGDGCVGGLFGLIDFNIDMNMTISNSVNNGNVTGSSYIGGLFGSFDKNTNMTVSIANSINNGIVDAEDSYVGGFVGEIGRNTNTNITISNSINNGNATGGFIVGGFVGVIYSESDSDSVTLCIMNSANKGSVSATDGMSCGFACVKPEGNMNVKTTMKNSINKGSVNATKDGYGIANIITEARNVVSMGDVTGPSGSFTFWNASTNVDLFYGLNGKCNNCSDDATLFQHNTTTGFYEVVGTGEHADDLLNAESEKQSYGMMWSSELDLYDPHVEPTPSSPLSGGKQHGVSTLCIGVVVVGLLGHMTMSH